MLDDPTDGYPAPVFVDLPGGGKYLHPLSAGAGGSSLADETPLVFRQGRGGEAGTDFGRIAVEVLAHPTWAVRTFLLRHGEQSTKCARPNTPVISLRPDP